MKISPVESEIMKKAYCHLHDAYHNIQCLFLFLKREYPDKASIEYTILLNGLLRMQEIEAIMGVTLNYPVLGKERDMANPEKLKNLLQDVLGVSQYGYLDFSDSHQHSCVNEELHLYEVQL